MCVAVMTLYRVHSRFMEDHSSSSLIWNYKVCVCACVRVCVCACELFFPQTREELREALENEIRSFTVDKVGFNRSYIIT